MASPTASLLSMWNRCQSLPGGGWLFSKLLGRRIPYTGSIGARVLVLEPGHARVELRDRRAVRNHLSSIHAIALMNLAEMTSGLAMHTDLAATERAILKGLSIQYLKKARGTITGDCHAKAPAPGTTTDLGLDIELTDSAGEVVCRAQADWRVGPAKRS